MFKSDSEIESKLEDSRNLAHRMPTPEPRRQIVDHSQRVEARYEHPEVEGDATILAPLHNGGRRDGDKDIPPFMRGIIASTARLDSIANTAEAFGLSERQVSNLKAGKTSQDAAPDAKLIDDVNARLTTPHNLAVDKLTQTLLEITPEKIKNISKVKELASLAVQLSSVAKNSQPIQKEPDDVGAKLVVHVPIFKQENHYASVAVGAKK